METLLSNPVPGLKINRKSEDSVIRFSENLLDSFQVLSKRVMDILLSSLFLVFIGLWLFPIIAILIKIDSKGPVFYKQLRDGQFNTKFYCFKFRTMTFNPEGQFKQATKNDPRITRIGAFLRKTSLDELPQLINVLIGDMSIVGPRPHAVEMNIDCERKYSNYRLRHLVKPGITGLAQAKGFRGEIKKEFDMRGRLKLDLLYIEKWSFFLDIKILFLTVKGIVLDNGNAY
ncbi:exopolysaccharide biosynthesis polyprenyl glycosylphosphotransferase [Cecembia lonarensis]|uniref:Putative colanic biosynthesis UDP-glucose lipid carrier transferase n=1 Tax=Cecembia lonarensis (strain CCUG 58316 / KCTC 22772 / LW9) TaxID=1225176 RepID=K1LLP7_CECL9|nr:exopolysaccharide biosynthesis polyprenyl glycosylphosphotransferase [Cecembia lonarensis]EKB51308.1 Putative colanic biosynthesis UDP-glucose lipid carrier transferase [Cecembia lonarensis LW9]